MTTFTDDQIKDRLDRATTTLVEKYGKRPGHGPDLQLSGQSWRVLCWINAGVTDPLHSSPATTALGAIDNWIEAIDERPDPAEMKRQEFMNDLAALIEKGNEAGVDIDFINPLSETMKRLSENALTYQPDQAEELRRKIARHQKEVDRLIEQYGEGVRPGWVSTDISIAQMNVNRYERELAELEPAENDPD